jgi:uncharacterized repeat protein (TIGR03803 family)
MRTAKPLLILVAMLAAASGLLTTAAPAFAASKDGTTYQGTTSGSYCDGFGCGIVFQLQPGANGTWTEKVLHSFHGEDGGLPYAGVIFDSAGNLYGTTNGGAAYGNGTVFEIMP